MRKIPEFHHISFLLTREYRKGLTGLATQRLIVGAGHAGGPARSCVTVNHPVCPLLCDALGISPRGTGLHEKSSTLRGTRSNTWMSIAVLRFLAVASLVYTHGLLPYTLHELCITLSIGDAACLVQNALHPSLHAYPGNVRHR